MKKKLVIVLITSTLLLTACGGNNSQTENSRSSFAQTQNNQSEAEQSESHASQESSSSVESTQNSTLESQSSLSDLDALGSIEVDEGLSEVTLTIPSGVIGEQTQEDLNKLCEEYGFQSITLNEDGSATYVMTKEKHKEYMEQYKAELTKRLAELIGSESYPNFTDVKANENFTEFTITTKSTELDMSESFSVMAFYLYGGMYNIFSGTPADNISVTFVNADSGEVISTSNSSESSN